MQTTQEKSINSENYIIELFKTILPYKWSIVLITLLAILLAKYHLYFIPSTYESYAILKVKVNKQIQTKDLLRDSLNNTNTVGIKEEILSLQTFKINKKTLKEVDFSIQYFQKNDYKMTELYDNAPISIELTEAMKSKNIHRKI